jgi:FKBP-type peptidyl-prolyl cis-trans isomerase
VAKVILKAGHGPGVKAGDTVTLHYTGTLTNGKKFDSSYDHPDHAPMTITVGGGVIPGFTLGLLGMKQGEKRRITIPWALAYGERGRPPVIPPKSDLIFVLEIVQVSR